MELWNEYQEEALARFKKANGGKLKDMILWTSHMTEPEFLHYLDPSIYTVQYWESSTNKQVNGIFLGGGANPSFPHFSPSPNPNFLHV